MNKPQCPTLRGRSNLTASLSLQAAGHPEKQAQTLSLGQTARTKPETPLALFRNRWPTWAGICTHSKDKPEPFLGWQFLAYFTESHF